jgi:hypothetical protein
VTNPAIRKEPGGLVVAFPAQRGVGDRLELSVHPAVTFPSASNWRDRDRLGGAAAGLAIGADVSYSPDERETLACGERASMASLLLRPLSHQGLSGTYPALTGPRLELELPSNLAARKSVRVEVDVETGGVGADAV